MKQSISKNVIRVSIKTVLTILVPLITFPYVSRVLQLEAYGKNNFASTIVGYFVMLSGLGISTYAIREGSRVRREPHKLTQLASEIFSVYSVSTLLASVLLLLAVFCIPKLESYRVLILIYGLELILNLFGMDYILNVYEDFTFLSRIQVLFQVISVPLTFLLVRSPDDLVIYVCIRLFATKGAELLYGFRVRKYVHLQRVSLKSSFEKHIKPILYVFGSNVGSHIYLFSDTAILGWMNGDADVGLYSAASRIYVMYKEVFGAVYPVLVPQLSESFGKEEFKSLFSRLVNMLFFAALPATTGLFMLSDNVILIIAGQSYADAIPTLRILCAASLFAFCCILLGFCVMMPAKMEKRFMIGTWCTAVFNIVTNILLIPKLHQNGAAITTVFSELLLAAVCYFSTRKIIDLRPCFRILGKDALGCAGIVLCCVFIKHFSFSLWAEAIICIVLSAGVYVLIEWAVANPIFYDYLKELNKLLPRSKKSV